MRLTARSDLTEPRVSTTRAGGPEAALAQRLDGDEIAVPRFARHARGNQNSRARRALLDRKRASRPVRRGAIDGEDARLQLVEDLDHPAGIGGRLRPASASNSTRISTRAPRPGVGGAVALGARAAHEDAGRGAVPAPFGGLGDQFAVAVELGDVGDDERGQAALDGQRLAAARDGALGLQILDEELQLRFRFALDAEGARDVALGDARGRSFAIGRRPAADEGDELLARRQRGGSRSAAARRPWRAPMFFDFARVPLLGPRKRPRAKVSSKAHGNKRRARQRRRRRAVQRRRPFRS